jgi:hypothetical protein
MRRTELVRALGQREFTADNVFKLATCGSEIYPCAVKQNHV